MDDYLSMINTPDEISCVLRGHMVLEEFLHLWIEKRTNTKGIFKGVFIPFRNKLKISRNLGLTKPHFDTIDEFNNIRNNFGHTKGYKIKDSEIDKLAKKVDSISQKQAFKKCAEFTASNTVQHGNIWIRTDFTFHDSNNQMKLFIIFISYMLKLAFWLQEEFDRRNIKIVIIEPLQG